MKFAKLIKRFRIEKAAGFSLSDIDPGDTCGYDIGKSAAKDMIADGLLRLTDSAPLIVARWRLIAVDSTSILVDPFVEHRARIERDQRRNQTQSNGDEKRAGRRHPANPFRRES